jgi:regulator of RNase E activity RraA
VVSGRLPRHQTIAPAATYHASVSSAPDRLPPEVLDLARAVSTATLSSQLQKRGFVHCSMHGVLPLRPGLRLAGCAFTLRYIPMREDLERTGEFDNRTNQQRVAVESVGPDDVLVIDARGDTRAATLGNILATRLMRRGAAGIVTDGAFRDTPAIRALDMPTYASGQSPDVSNQIHHPQDINVPIGCAGVAVVPGDLVVGDGEGVMIVPRGLAEEVVRAAYEQEQSEEFILSKIDSGSSILGVYPPDEATLREYALWQQTSAGLTRR